MTPPARLAAAIGILDRWLAGTPAEQALTNWARGSRFAGSGDRAAVRDLVFDAIRCKRSFAALGGSETGRGLVIGSLRASGQDVAAMFTGIGHAPAELTDEEQRIPPPPGDLQALDCPDWLAPALGVSLGKDFAPVMECLRHRAPTFLRVNTARISRAAAQAALAQGGIESRPHDLAATALEVTANARKISAAPAYLDGRVELQDAASQAAVAEIPLPRTGSILDYCAGGGGKTLAMAAASHARLDAHDSDAGRMRDLAARATRAGVNIRICMPDHIFTPESYELVVTDVPCSGSGSWRRAPEAKWVLTPERLAGLVSLQARILDQTAPLVAPLGRLAYVTCSLLQIENQDQIAAFLARSAGWSVEKQRIFTPLQGGDGFFVAILKRTE